MSTQRNNIFRFSGKIKNCFLQLEFECSGISAGKKSRPGEKVKTLDLLPPSNSAAPPQRGEGVKCAHQFQQSGQEQKVGKEANVSNSAEEKLMIAQRISIKSAAVYHITTGDEQS